ncbi:hypothetical protein BT63DRAFT_281251 [Microthyrium microscopicum]|uniref:Helicase C-terminal domain-containing protein n=1 Tax=Microthyrium microscopicum TaxID=703497 RepID=A0A6A6UAJ1_9PEZI|nr:hypothetical protein BT63DRAFT_281251 [Microthyrium microscopicum]
MNESNMSRRRLMGLTSLDDTGTYSSSIPMSEHVPQFHITDLNSGPSSPIIIPRGGLRLPHQAIDKQPIAEVIDWIKLLLKQASVIDKMANQGVDIPLELRVQHPKLYGFQSWGVSTMRYLELFGKIGSSILADSTKLGKIRQAVALVKFFPVSNTLIVVPKQLIPTWIKELESFELSYSEDIAQECSEGILLLSHDEFTDAHEEAMRLRPRGSSHSAVLLRKWDRFICDEAHKRSSKGANLCNAITDLPGKTHRHLLVDIVDFNDLHAYFQMCHIIPFMAYDNFSELFVRKEQIGALWTVRHLPSEVQTLLSSSLFAITIKRNELINGTSTSHRPAIQRQLKPVCQKKLDEQLQEPTAGWWQPHTGEAVPLESNFLIAGNQDDREQLLRARLALVHPFLVNRSHVYRTTDMAEDFAVVAEEGSNDEAIDYHFEAEETDGEGEASDDEGDGTTHRELMNLMIDGGWRLSGMIEAALPLIKHQIASGKVLIFCPFEEGLDIMELALKEQYDMDCLILKGRMDPDEQQTMCEEFQTNDNIQVMLLTVAGSKGLDLTMAKSVIFLSPEYNLDRKLEAIRCVDQAQQAAQTYVITLRSKRSIASYILNRHKIQATKSAQLVSEAQRQLNRTWFALEDDTIKNLIMSLVDSPNSFPNSLG